MMLYIKSCNKGFTLIELIVVIAVFSVLSLVVMPRIINYLSSTKDNFLLLTSSIIKTYDDTFINKRSNYLVIHCYDSNESLSDITNPIFERTNGVSVVLLNENYEFVDNPNRLLKYRKFPSSFAIKEVILPDGSQHASGNIFIPFNPSGFSGGAIIHILVNDEEEWSVIIRPYLKKPKVIKGYISYEDIR